MTNGTMVTEFILVGFSVTSEWGLVLSLLFLVIYLITVTGNVIIIALVCTDYRLHTPMYFFLSNLSLLEVLLTSVIVPRMLANLMAGRKSVSFAGCVSQSYFYFSLGVGEVFLLGVMSLDRYVAICNPLRYSTIMNGKRCLQLAVGSWAVSFVTFIGPALLVSSLPYCGPNVLNHFFCDNVTLFKLSCTDTRNLELMDFIIASTVVFSSLLLTIISYIYIITTILCIPSTQGRQKAFSTCASHITVVSIFYGSTLFMYVRPTQSSLDLKKVVALMTAIVTPLLNPFIYCLRNAKVKEALRDTLQRSHGCSEKLKCLNWFLKARIEKQKEVKKNDKNAS
ncbi:olfactory receptor 6M1-like [Ambystoma mexicanum]|uniref:olfactory receptor 6M1-like n=1 Tax=Ambystoma mexicanum TaxID=8296 RepID=UPI0037E89360